MSKKYTFDGVYYMVKADYHNMGLTFAEVALYSYIDTFASAGNVVKCSNNYLAQMLGSNEKSISNLISSLEKKGFIERRMKPTKWGVKRELWAIDRISGIRKGRDKLQDELAEEIESETEESHSIKSVPHVHKKWRAHSIYNGVNITCVQPLGFTGGNGEEDEEAEQSGALDSNACDETSGDENVKVETSNRGGNNNTATAQVNPPQTGFDFALSNPQNPEGTTSVRGDVFYVKNGTWVLPQDFRDSLEETYSHLDIDNQIKRARIWCEANPSKRKTARGMKKFLNSWMANATTNKSMPTKSNMDTWKPQINMPNNWRTRMKKMLTEDRHLFNDKAISIYSAILAKKDEKLDQGDQQEVRQLEQEGLL